MKSKGAALGWLGESLVVRDVELADLEAGEAVVHLVACGISYVEPRRGFQRGSDRLRCDGAGPRRDLITAACRRCDLRRTQGCDRVPTLVRRCSVGEIHGKPSISHKFRLDAANEGFDRLSRKMELGGVSELA